MAEVIMQKVKGCNGYLPGKDIDKVHAVVIGNAHGLWEGGHEGMGNKKTMDNVLRAMCLMRCITEQNENTTASTHVMQLQLLIDAALKLALNEKTSGKTVTLCIHFLSLWSSSLPEIVAQHDFSKPSSLSYLLTTLGTTPHLLPHTPSIASWLSTKYRHLSLPPLLHLLHAAPTPPPAAHTALQTTRDHIFSKLFLTTEHKKNTALDTDGSKLPTSEQWTFLNIPVSTSVGYTEMQEAHALAFSTIPALLNEETAPQAHPYCMKLLMQIGKYITQKSFILSSQTGSGVGIAFMEAVVIQLVEALSELVQLLPECRAEVDGEVMGLFFQMLPQSRKSTSLPPPRCHSNVAGWQGEDPLTKAIVSSATARGDNAPPQAALSTHVPPEFLLENAADNIAATESGHTAAVPIWNGTVFIAVLEYFASSSSDTEAAVVEAFFESQHWVYYPHNITFAPTLFRYLLKYSNRPSFDNVRKGLYLKVLRVASLSPYSSASSLLKLLPCLINRTTYLDLLHRVLDLGLLSHLQSKQSIAIDGSNLGQVFGNEFQHGLAAALYSDTVCDNPEEAPYCAFWLENKNSVETWVAEVEAWALSRKAVGMAKHIPRLLNKYFNCISFEAERDPIMTVNIATLILRRYHMLSMPSACAREVRAFLLQQVYTFISNTPQILDLITDELLSCVRQYHISKKSHRCLYLTGCSAVILSQGVLRVVKPPTDPSSSVPKNVKLIFTELHKALYDVLALLYKREVGMVRGMYVAKTPLYKVVEKKKSRSNPNKNLHDTLEAAYTVWDAVECIDCLSVAMATIGILCPEFLDTAKSSCVSVVRAAKFGVLPPTTLTATLTLQSWLSRPALALSSVVRPTPPVGTSPLCTDGQATLLGLLPRPAHQQFRVD